MIKVTDKNGKSWLVKRLTGNPDINKPETHLQRMYQVDGDMWVDTYDGKSVKLSKKRQKAGNAVYIREV